jgi:hypothetical protein
MALAYLYLWRWLRLRRQEVRKLVADGEADWAASCRVLRGAALLAGGAVTPTRPQATGKLLATGDRLEWRPDSWSLHDGWLPGTHRIADLRVVYIARRRDLVAGELRVLHLAAPGGEIVAALTAEAGQAPPAFRGLGRPAA